MSDHKNLFANCSDIPEAMGVQFFLTAANLGGKPFFQNKHTKGFNPPSQFLKNHLRKEFLILLLRVLRFLFICLTVPIFARTKLGDANAQR